MTGDAKVKTAGFVETGQSGPIECLNANRITFGNKTLRLLLLNLPPQKCASSWSNPIQPNPRAPQQRWHDLNDTLIVTLTKLRSNQSDSVGGGGFWFYKRDVSFPRVFVDWLKCNETTTRRWTDQSNWICNLNRYSVFSFTHKSLWLVCYDYILLLHYSFWSGSVSTEAPSRANVIRLFSLPAHIISSLL